MNYAKSYPKGYPKGYQSMASTQSRQPSSQRSWVLWELLSSESPPAQKSKYRETPLRLHPLPPGQALLSTSPMSSRLQHTKNNLSLRNRVTSL